MIRNHLMINILNNKKLCDGRERMVKDQLIVIIMNDIPSEDGLVRIIQK